MVLQEPRRAVLALGLQTTPQAVFTFAKVLGVEMRVFETTVGDHENVHITKFMPNLAAYPVFASSPKVAAGNSTSRDIFRSTIMPGFGSKGTQITSLTCRTEFMTLEAKLGLDNRLAAVETF